MSEGDNMGQMGGDAVKKIMGDWKFYLSVAAGAVSLGLMIKYILKTDEIVNEEIPKERTSSKESGDSQQNPETSEDNTMMNFLKLYGGSENRTEEKPIYELNHPPVETSPQTQQEKLDRLKHMHNTMSIPSALKDKHGKAVW